MDEIISLTTGPIYVQGVSVDVKVKQAGIFVCSNEKFEIRARVLFPGDNVLTVFPRTNKSGTNISKGEKIGILLPFSLLEPKPEPVAVSEPEPEPEQETVAEEEEKEGQDEQEPKRTVRKPTGRKPLKRK